jgi:hypothetical protein
MFFYFGRGMILTKYSSYRIILTIGVLILSAFMLFFNLGHSALWDDEATTALFGQSIWRTGDTYAILDHNIVAYNSGVELKNLRNRYLSPLQFYLVAPFVGCYPTSSWAARFPFAVCGLLTIGMMLLWLWKSRSLISTWLLMAAGILGNVSLMLYSRQCRYYAPVILFSVVLAFLYFYHNGRRWTLFLLALVSLMLFASNYLSYVATYVCLLIDYFFWGRKKRPFKFPELAIIFLPQILLGAFLASVYNPFGKNVWDNTSLSWGSDKITLFLWNLRELNSCELGVGAFIFLAPLLYIFKKDSRFIRCSFAVFIYVFVISLLSPQPISLLSVAFVRYLAPLIPLCIFISVITIQTLTTRFKVLTVLLAILAFGTNVLHGGPIVGIDRTTSFSQIIAKGHFRSTILEFIQELISPPPSAYRDTADWINHVLKDNESIWVMPSYATYPLMFHAPKAKYAWLLQEETGQFRGLPEIYFFGRIPPDYIIAFGPYNSEMKVRLDRMEKTGIQYEIIKQIDRYWYDLTRPELFWHSFHEIRNYSSLETIKIYKRGK